MKHTFYQKTKKEQNRIFAIIAIGAIIVFLLAVFISFKFNFHLIAILTFASTLSIIAPFFDMPSLKKSGKMIYYSPLFVTEKPKNGTIKIHGGTLFDYSFVIDKKMNGKQRTDFIIQQYMQGLLCLIEMHENTSDLKICGTSYIINQRTAEKLGFKVIKTDFLKRFILIYNYFNILISNSIAKNKLSFPKLNNTITFETDFKQLMEHKV
ncbi:hypothetical protein [Bizionia myxarmorum]|uniref:Uncharacterized protein n=1 Tax=Bizionia myxarmorum TaxID=291186 RepID=A0A5D0R2W1_9FLAO|nr:hypothetical protein [Bizionia myxarmorum]TYB75862.1 hypothetical protein ES674_13660 [Bizionia myxarmorum]